MYQYSLGIQEQLKNNLVATIGYVGNKSSHLSDTNNINLLPLNDIADRINVCGPACGGAPFTQADPFRRYRGWSGINILEDQTNAHYHGLQATLRASSWHNWNFGIAYTYSHAWDQLDGQIFANLSNPYDPKYDSGTAGFDRRQVAVANFDYVVPFFQHSNGLSRTMLGGAPRTLVRLSERRLPCRTDWPTRSMSRRATSERTARAASRNASAIGAPPVSMSPSDMAKPP